MDRRFSHAADFVGEMEQPCGMSVDAGRFCPGPRRRSITESAGSDASWRLETNLAVSGCNPLLDAVD